MLVITASAVSVGASGVFHSALTILADDADGVAFIAIEHDDRLPVLLQHQAHQINEGEWADKSGRRRSSGRGRLPFRQGWFFGHLCPAD